MAVDSCTGRDQAFRDLLFSVSKQLSESDVEVLRYLADLGGQAASCKGLELLKAVRNKGMFSPNSCSPLAELLRKIERHDLADEVTNKYVAVFPDQAALVVEGRNGRRRSATDPLPPLTKSTSVTLDYSTSTNGSMSLPQSFSGGQIAGTGSLENMFPTTPTGGPPLSFDAHNQAGDTQDYSHIPPSTTSTSLKSMSQSSQDHSYSSNGSSNSSSYNSLNSATEAVLDRTSTMLFHHVTATLSLSLPRNQESITPSPVQMPVAQTLSPRISPLPLVHHKQPPGGALEAIRVSEIYSDQEEGGFEERRDTLECPAAVASRHRKSQGKRPRQFITESGGGSLHPDQKDSRTPRASLLLQDEGMGDLETTMTSQGLGTEPDSTAQQSTVTEGPTDSPRHTNKSSSSSSTKEKHWKKCLNIFGKHKTRQSSGNSVTWRVPREDLGKPIWNHEEKCCISRSHKFELDTNLGRHNPKLLFQLYPYGESSDCGEYMTMIVRITTSEKCPPLPSTASVQISLTVRDEHSDGENSILNRISVEEHLNLGYFPIRQVVQHQQLKKSRSKYIYFNMEIHCCRLESNQQTRQTL